MGIYVFHQGLDRNEPPAPDGQLWYSYFDGENWAPDTLVPNVGISSSPSAVVLPGGGLSVFHQGEGDNGQLWYSYFDGTNWAPDVQVPNVGMSISPAAILY